MKKVFRTGFIFSLLILALGVGITIGIVLDRQVISANAMPVDSPTNASLNYQLITDAYNKIQEYFVDRPAIQSTQLTYGAISGMVDALGDTGHSRFLTPEMVKEEQNMTQGHFDGIGVEVEMKNGQMVIVAPIDNSPAQKAGIHAGDIIVKVNGEDIQNLPLDQIVGKIQGQAGTQVTITIMDGSTGALRDVTLTRARITIHNVTWQPIPGTTIADIRIASFSQGVTIDLQAALQDAQKQGMTGIILDLRNNPGGLLDEAVGVTSLFEKSGNVLLTKDANGKITPVPVKNIGTVTDLPMIILVNQGTASAAEIVSGALQDAHRATLVGETTFGTGTVLNEFGLPDGSALLLATQEWLTPNGRVIWHQGITPDQVVQDPANVTLLTPEILTGMTAAQLQSSGDQQVLKAINLLSNPVDISCTPACVSSR
jgi:carboxyl-terminal processing protease